MKQYIIIILIALHLISSNLYAVNTFSKQHNADFNLYKCSFHKHVHDHYHTHNGSNHQHKHSHVQKTINVLDFFVQLDATQPSVILYSKEKYLETNFFIANHTLESNFRPPIV
jgi:hypothetical protein